MEHCRGPDDNFIRAGFDRVDVVAGEGVLFTLENLSVSAIELGNSCLETMDFLGQRYARIEEDIQSELAVRLSPETEAGAMVVTLGVDAVRSKLSEGVVVVESEAVDI